MVTATKSDIQRVIGPEIVGCKTRRACQPPGPDVSGTLRRWDAASRAESRHSRNGKFRATCSLHDPALAKHED
jgi:hypothetical protein